MSQERINPDCKQPYQMAEIAITSVTRSTTALERGRGQTLGKLIDDLLSGQQGTPQEIKVKLGKMRYPKE